MRITVLITLVLLVNFSIAADGQKVTLSAHNTSLRSVMDRIQEQTGYKFLYVKDYLSASRPVNIRISNAPLRNVLDLIFADQPLSYVIDSNVIIIRKKISPVGVSPVIIKDTLSGRILDEEGKPLAGAGILVRNSKRGTITNDKGEFAILLSPGEVVSIGYVGYESKELAFSQQTSVEIRLKKRETNLADVVVIGYGSVSAKNTTGAISSLKAKDLSVGTSSNFAQNLQGKAAGVQVTQATGQPGANAKIMIRSNPSPNDPGVLYVIDGVPVNTGAAQPQLTGTIGANKYPTAGVDQSPMNFINPNDIQSVEFLKDPSSTAIYGAKAGSGVVLITTKRGTQRRSGIDYSGNYGIQRVDKMWSVYGAKDYMLQRNQIAEQVWERTNTIAPYYGTTDIASVTPFKPIYSQGQIDSATNSNENAMKAILQTAYTQQHNLSLSGGNDRTTYFASGNYFEQQGVITGTDYRRYNGRLNLEHKVSDKIKIGANVLVSGSVANNTITGGDAGKWRHHYGCPVLGTGASPEEAGRNLSDQPILFQYPQSAFLRYGYQPHQIHPDTEQRLRRMEDHSGIDCQGAIRL